jgi:hypothetical protein
MSTRFLATTRRGFQVSAGQLLTQVDVDTDRRGAGRGKVLIEARENPAERVEATRQEPMQLAGLRRARAMRGRIGNPVPFHDGHLLEMLRERTRGREAAHAGSDHQRLPPQQVGHGLISSSVRERANTLRVTRPRYVLQCFRRCSPIDEIGFDCNTILIIAPEPDYRGGRPLRTTRSISLRPTPMSRSN